MAPGADVNTTLPLVLSIVCLACCCLPLGIGGLVFAMNANNAKKTGDLATAQAKAKTSLILSIIGMVGGVIIGTVYGVLMAMNNGSM
jgi:ABC-type Fe3+ transport system permease subunit